MVYANLNLRNVWTEIRSDNGARHHPSLLWYKLDRVDSIAGLKSNLLKRVEEDFRRVRVDKVKLIEVWADSEHWHRKSVLFNQQYSRSQD